MSALLALLDRRFLLVGLAVLAVAACLRLVDLALVPMHNDEGVNGWFVTRLARMGIWNYDPANYHGPTLFFLGLASEILFGLNTEAMRLVPALFGIGTVALVLALRPFIGSIAALTAAGLVAVSPGATYISRYFIHEALLAFFTLAIVVSLLWYLRDGRERFLLLAAAVAAAHFATKETGIISLIVLGIALVVGVEYVRFRSASPAAGSGAARRAHNRPAGVSWRAEWHRRLPPERLVTAGFVFLAVYLPLFSSFGANLQGLADSLATFTVWTQTGGQTQVQPLQQYLAWMAAADAPILVMGVIGGLIAAWRGRERVAVFIGLWALGVTAAYSLISYKTPWIALNMLVPLAVLGGLAVREALERVRSLRLRTVAASGIAIAFGLGAFQTLDLNFNHYDDETYPYVFVHTTREALALVDDTEAIAARAGSERNGIVFFSPDHWPLPWYYRDNPRAGFFGRIVETDEAVVVASVSQEAEVDVALGTRYVRGAVYRLRPGVDLVVYTRADLAGR